jgi:hypothetical protein
MELAAQERMIVLHILPPTGDITTLKALRVFKEDLVLSEEEVKSIDYEVEEKDGQILSKWNLAKGKELIKDVDVPPVLHVLIKKSLEDMATAEPPTLEDKHIELWDKFCA